MVSVLAQDLIQVVDTAFLGRVGEIELGASAIGGLFYFLLFILAFGFGTGTQIIIGRRNGEKDYKAIGKVMDQSLYFLMVVALLVFLAIITSTGPVMRMLLASDEVAKASEAYLDVRIWGLFFACLNIAFRAFFVGIAKTKVLIWNAFFMAGINVLFDYALIFGKLGMPEMGLKGAALASVLAEATSTLFFFIYTYRVVDIRKYGIFRFSKPDMVTVGKILNVSVFIMIQFALSMAAWFTFFLIIEKLGERELAISNIIRSIYMLLIIPVWAFGSTTSTLVSNIIGEGHKDKVLPLVYRVLWLTMASIGVIAILGAIAPVTLLKIYTQDAGLIAEALPVLYVILGAIAFFGAANIFFHGVAGTANTRVSMWIEIITLTFYLGVAFVLGIILKVPVAQVWYFEYVYFLIMGSLSWRYLKSGKWKSFAI